MSIPQNLLSLLKLIENDADFSGSLPKIRSSTGKTYFVKQGSPSEAEQYTGEAESLKAICHAAPGLAPMVFAAGTTDGGKPYFISEYKDIGSLGNNAKTELAKRLATELHTYKSTEGFGFGVPTYCGATRMENGWFETWEKCYAAKIDELLKQLREQGKQYKTLCEKGGRVKNEVIPKLLGPLTIQPVLLHGDLWSGNAGTDSGTGQPVIYDPSSYYGHNEADLAIARIFGGFGSTFFAEYHKHLPKSEPQSQYELRCDLYELYHYLNHAVLFGGGGYASSAAAKMERLLEADL
ncbi:fructosamine kinase pkl cak [Moniliophthora roreri MCA 2997]|uniref:protein-ribulosamine 3-kinase n=1 Tax=Moniliophthora roreri (strain MCA 2997) TaxID=1381753 RepID=V2Z2L1_MONRO|nr:fructosamine kinase pkl cak [Moniliophthora roreri MCA 2997]